MCLKHRFFAVFFAQLRGFLRGIPPLSLTLVKERTPRLPHVLECLTTQMESDHVTWNQLQ